MSIFDTLKQKIDEYFTPTSNVRVRDMVREIPSTVKEFVTPARGYTEKELAKAKPTIKEKIQAPIKAFTEIGTSLGQLASEYIPQPEFMAKTAQTGVGQLLMKAGDILEKYAKPKTAGEAKAMRVVDVASFLPIGQIKNVSKVISKLDDVVKISKELKGLGLADDVIETTAKTLKDVTDPTEVSKIITEAQETALKGSKLPLEDSKVESEGLIQPEELARRDRIATAIDESSQRLANEQVAQQTLSEKIRQAEITKPEKTGLFAKLKESLYPLKTQDPVIQDAYTKMARKNLVARELANEEISKIAIPNKEGLDTIINYQKGNPTPYSAKLKEVFDGFFKEAKNRGIEFEYQDNYLPQVYNNTTKEIKEAMARFLKDVGVDDYNIKQYVDEIKALPDTISKGLKINPFFSKDKAFPTYEVAMKYGLTPKYTNPAQLISHYRQELEKTVANKEFLDTLTEQAKILPEQVAPRNWEPIKSPPILKGYFAEPKTAKMLEGIYRNEETLGFTDYVFKTVANVSKRMQEIALSAGVPKTNINFFSIGQLVKSMTAGDFKTVVLFLRANFDNASINYFKANQNILKKMADEGLNLGDHIGNFSKIYENTAKPTLKDVVSKSSGAIEKTKSVANYLSRETGEQFDKLFNDKTFGSFMPQLYTQTFKDAYKKAMLSMPENEASKFAGDVTRKFFGLMEDVGRSKGTQDKLSATFFAPKFREGIINTLFNTGKAGAEIVSSLGGLRKPLTPALYKNRKLLGGMTLTYGLYNLLNKELTGHYMWENPSGREFALQIPTEGDEVVYVEFMPSFLAFARNIASGGIALAGGDVKTATQKFGSVFSMPVKITSEVLSNKDYFGREIYKDTDSTGEKAKKIGSYIGLAVNHPYIEELVNQIQEKKPLHQSLIYATELPIKFGSKEKIVKQEWYEAMDKREQERANLKKQVMPIYENVQKLISEDKESEAQAIVDNLSDEEYEIYKTIKTSAKSFATKEAQIKMMPTVKKVQELVKQGKETEAKAIVDAMSDEEYRIYKLAKQKLK